MSRGFGFVRMATEAASILAVERLNQFPVCFGKRLAVRFKGRPPSSETQQKVRRLGFSGVRWRTRFYDAHYEPSVVSCVAKFLV